MSHPYELAMGTYELSTCMHDFALRCCSHHRARLPGLYGLYSTSRNDSIDFRGVTPSRQRIFHDEDEWMMMINGCRSITRRWNGWPESSTYVPMVSVVASNEFLMLWHIILMSRRCTNEKTKKMSYSPITEKQDNNENNITWNTFYMSSHAPST